VVLLIRLYRMKTDEPVKLYSREMQRSISRISIPGMLQQSFVSVGNLFIQRFVNEFGVNALAGYQSAIKLNTFTVTVMATMSNGASSFTAQNLGAGKVERIRKGFKNCIAIMCGTAFVLSVIFTVFAPQLAGLFLDSSAADNKEALEIGTTFLRIVSPAFCIVAAKLCCDGFLKGGGAMKEFMIGTFADLLLRVLLSLVLSGFFDETGIWMSWPIGWFIAACMSFYYYKKDRWLHSN
jgi:Na+-driven multidrug efflux pump